MPSLDQPMSTWVPAATAVLSQYPPADGVARTGNRLVRTGKATSTARTITGLATAAATSARPRLSTIHQAKGDQAEAVLLLMPTSSVTDRTLTAWLTDTASDVEVTEALRVLYVGVTRAQRLLGLAVSHLPPRAGPSPPTRPHHPDRTKGEIGARRTSYAGSSPASEPGCSSSSPGPRLTKGLPCGSPISSPL